MRKNAQDSLPHQVVQVNNFFGIDTTATVFVGKCWSHLQLREYVGLQGQHSHGESPVIEISDSWPNRPENAPFQGPKSALHPVRFEQKEAASRYPVLVSIRVHLYDRR